MRPVVAQLPLPHRLAAVAASTASVRGHDADVQGRRAAGDGNFRVDIGRAECWGVGHQPGQLGDGRRVGDVDKRFPYLFTPGS